jgi:hypothetical protein
MSARSDGRSRVPRLQRALWIEILKLDNTAPEGRCRGVHHLIHAVDDAGAAEMTARTRCTAPPDGRAQRSLTAWIRGIDHLENSA